MQNIIEFNKNRIDMDATIEQSTVFCDFSRNSIMMEATEEQSKKFLEFIKNGSSKDIEDFVEAHPMIRQTYNEEKESAVAISLKLKKIDIYKLLITRGWRLEPGESLYELVRNYDDSVKNELRDFHKSIAFSPTVEHLVTLIKKSSFSPMIHSVKWRTLRNQISEMFEDLNEIEWIGPILRIVANSEELSILFDADKETVENIDPNAKPGTKGSEQKA